MIKSTDNEGKGALSAGPVRCAQWIRQTTMVFAGVCSGVVLYEALFPGFYYMVWIVCLPLLWGLVAVAFLGQALALLLVARWRRDPPAPCPHAGWGFLLGLLVLVTVLIGFKVPLRASFLLAKPDLEEAVALHADDLDEVGRVAKFHYCGIYPIERAERRCHRKDRIYFRFRDDGESAIIYSESGIQDLCYNSGAKGQLFGNWYWMKED